MSESKISVIIPVRNGADHIEKCLEAVFSQSYPPLEVVMVDGHSTDDTVPRAQKFPIKVLYESYHTRGGACQVGVEHAQGEYVAFTDADCIPDKDWLANLVREFSNGIVGVGGQTRYEGKTLWSHSIDLAFATLLGSGKSVEGRLFKKRRFVSSISGCNGAYRKQDVLAAGGFNTGFISEDTELNKRLLKRGKLLYVPTAIVIHAQEECLRGFAKRIHKWGRTRVVTRKWDLPVIPAFVIPLLLLSLTITPWAILGAAGLYLLTLAFMGLRFALRERNICYLASIPIVYAVEHSAYTVGIWREIIWPYKRSNMEASRQSD